MDVYSSKKALQNGSIIAEWVDRCRLGRYVAEWVDFRKKSTLTNISIAFSAKLNRPINKSTVSRKKYELIQKSVANWVECRRMGCCRMGRCTVY